MLEHGKCETNKKVGCKNDKHIIIFIKYGKLKNKRHTTLPRVPCSVRVCRAVKTSSNYLLMVFIPRSHPESQSAGLLLVNVPHSDRWLAELFPPRIQFVTLSECCKGIHINSEEDQTIIIRSHRTVTKLPRIELCPFLVNHNTPLTRDNSMSKSPYQKPMFRSRDLLACVVTSLLSGLAVSPYLLPVWSWPVSSASAPVYSTTTVRMEACPAYHLIALIVVCLTSLVSFFIFFLLALVSCASRSFLSRL